MSGMRTSSGLLRANEAELLKRGKARLQAKRHTKKAHFANEVGFFCVTNGMLYPCVVWLIGHLNPNAFAVEGDGHAEDVGHTGGA